MSPQEFDAQVIAMMDPPAPDAEALFSAVEQHGAALVAALKACEAAGLCTSEAAESAAKVASTVGMRERLAEKMRPKGPMVTITRPRSTVTFEREVGKITDASIILIDGARYDRADGYRTGAAHHRTRWDRTRITPEEIARIVALGWTPPKPAKKATKK